MSTFWRAVSRTGAPIATAAFLSRYDSRPKLLCEAETQEPKVQVPPPSTETKPSAIDTQNGAGLKHDAEGDYSDLFPNRQLWRPKLEYPLWDNNWDGREPPSTGDPEQDRKLSQKIRSKGVTRHIIMVRHGQYDETFKDDEKRILTDLGREQAALTGKRIAEMLRGAEDDFGPCNVKVVRVSGMARARETASIIASHIPGVACDEPDPALSEGRPCHHIPGGRPSPRNVLQMDENHPRIEGAYQKLFYRSIMDDEATNQDSDKPKTKGEKHEFEIVVCHANVIRYFLCRSLQLPPEAWLRFCPFNCSLTYVTIRPTGTVSCRMLGDIGHLPYGKSTFSGHHGFNW